eukprot:355647-Chlamydomonas_euryale.AAC.4
MGDHCASTVNVERKSALRKHAHRSARPPGGVRAARRQGRRRSRGRAPAGAPSTADLRWQTCGHMRAAHITPGHSPKQLQLFLITGSKKLDLLHPVTQPGLQSVDACIPCRRRVRQLASAY